MLRLERLAYALAWSLPAALLVLVLMTVVNVPLADEWGWAPLIVKMHEGTLRVADLWAQQGAHRSFFPTALALGLAKAFGWSTRIETAASVLLAAATQALLFRALALTVPRERRAATFLVASLLLFSLLQSENWVWGFQISWFLVNLCVVMVVAVLAAPRLRDSGAVLAMLAAVVASYSLLFGFGAWVAGGVVLALRREWRVLAAWIAVAVLVLAVFLAGYRPPVDDPGWRLTLAHPERIVAFVLVYLGAPLALWAGAIASAMCGLALLAGWIAARSRGAAQAPWYGLAAFVAVAALLEAIGRASGGLGSALASHYTTTSALAWIALLAVTSSRALRWPLAALAFAGSCVGAFSLLIAHGYQEDARDAILADRNLAGSALQGYPLWSQVRRDDVEALRRVGDGPFLDASSGGRPLPPTIGSLPPPTAAPWLYDADAPQIVDVAVSTKAVRSGDAVMMRVVTTTNVAAVTVALGPIAANLPRRAPGIFEGRAPIARYPEVPLLFPRDSDLVVIATNSQGERAFGSVRIRLL